MINTLTQTPLLDAFPRLFRPSVPVVLQSESSECGLACLAMIAGYHGKAPNMRVLREQHAISSHGANLKYLLSIASQLSLSTRAVKLDMASLNELTVPCMLHWDMNHFVVLTQVSKNKVVIHDPASGKRVMSLNEVSDHFTGIAVECAPTPAFEKTKPAPALTLWQFVQSATGLKRYAFALFLLSLVLQVFAIASPYYMQLVVDDVIVGNNADLLTALAIGFGLLLLIEIAVDCFRQFLMLNLTSRLNTQLSANVFYRLIRLPFSFFHKRHLGDITSRFGSLSPIRNMLSQGIIAVVLDGLMAIVTLIVMFIYNVKLAFISLTFTSLYFALKWVMYRPIHDLSMQSLAASAQESSHFMESVRAIKTIKLFGHENDRQNEWQNKLVAHLNNEIQLSRWQISLTTVNRLLFGIENLVVIYFAATAVMGNVISVGMLYAFISYKSRFTGAMDGVINALIEYRLLGVHFDRLSDLVLTPSETHNHNQPSPIVQESTGSQSLVVDQLSYQYSPQSAQVFSNTSVTFDAGDCVAIVGPSGSGKTTLLHCLMGLLQPSSGHIQWNGQNIQGNETFRSSIGAVMQDDHCLAGSIANNIACFDHHIDMQRVVWCAQMACIHEDIATMPMQYQTLVGDMGSALSGGQLQRILIARALYRQPAIIFMDEATAHLDTETEIKVNANLRNLSITRIIVAHRPQTIAMADKVYCLQQGTLTQTSVEGEQR